MNYLEKDEMDALLAAPDITTLNKLASVMTLTRPDADVSVEKVA